MDQMTFGLDPLPKKTRKEVFLDEMNQVVPWAALVALIVDGAAASPWSAGMSAPGVRRKAAEALELLPRVVIGVLQTFLSLSSWQPTLVSTFLVAFRSAYTF